jgi:hypothetical protein
MSSSVRDSRTQTEHYPGLARGNGVAVASGCAHPKIPIDEFSSATGWPLHDWRRTRAASLAKRGVESYAELVVLINRISPPARR